MKLKTLFYMLFLGMLIAQVGCAPYAVIKQDYDFSKIKRVGILEFSSVYGKDVYNPGDAVADEFVRQLMSKGIDVVERQRLNAVLNEYDLAVRGVVDLSSEARQKIKKVFGVDALVTGTIVKYAPDRRDVIYFKDENGEIKNTIFMIDAEVGISARMIDVETGLIVWSSSYTSDSLDVEGAIYYGVSVLLNTLKGKLIF